MGKGSSTRKMLKAKGRRQKKARMLRHAEAKRKERARR